MTTDCNVLSEKKTRNQLARNTHKPFRCVTIDNRKWTNLRVYIDWLVGWLWLFNLDDTIETIRSALCAYSRSEKCQQNLTHFRLNAKSENTSERCGGVVRRWHDCTPHSLRLTRSTISRNLIAIVKNQHQQHRQQQNNQLFKHSSIFYRKITYFQAIKKNYYIVSTVKSFKTQSLNK